MLVERLEDFLGILSNAGAHGFLDHIHEPIAALVALVVEVLDDPPNVIHRVVDLGRVFAAEFHNLDGIPNDVVLADRLKPEGLDTDRAATDFRVPEEETRREGLAVDVRPAQGINEKAEHVLLPAIESRAATRRRLRRLKVHREFLDKSEEIRVVQAGVACAVDRADVLALGEHLKRLRAARHGLPEHLARRRRTQLVEGILADLGESAKLAKAPVVEPEGFRLPKSQRQVLPVYVGDHEGRRMPLIE